MSVATQTLNGHKIQQKPIADVILKSLEQAQWNGRGFKNLHADISVARGKAHGSAIHKALKSLRDADLIVMQGERGNRRTTYYLPRYVPGAKRGPISVTAAPARRPPGRPRRHVRTDVVIDIEMADGLPAETGVRVVEDALAKFSQASASAAAETLDRELMQGSDSVDEAVRFILSDPEDAPAPTAEVLPASVADLAERIAESVRETVVTLLGAELSKAHADAAAALKLAEDAEARYNELKAKLAALA